MLWSGFHFKSEFLDSENIIAKLHLLMQLERSDPYSHRNVALMPLTDRIKTSLAYVPDEHRPFVLAIFANTIYFPNQFSYAVLQHLMNIVINRYSLNENIGENCLILEQDPTGIVNEFLRRNSIPGRLDNSTFQRTQQVKSFIQQAAKQLDAGDIKNSEDLRPFVDKKYWIVLSDNSLSGTSLCSDLERFCEFAIKYDKKPIIIVLIRTLAEKANNRIKQLISKYRNDIEINYYYGLLLKNEFSINPNNGHCKLFSSKTTFYGALKACEWLATKSEYINDKALADHKKHSVGNNNDDNYNMAYGFKECGLTFVSSENCPSDSLPLLWYNNPSIYVPPFPRVLSRIGGLK